MAVLVIGAGYIGARLVSELLADGEEVVLVENFFATDPGAVQRLAANPNCHLVTGNFANAGVLRTAFQGRHIDTVYLLAAQASAHPSAAPPRYTEETNLLAPRRLLETMVRHNVRSLVYASSLRVYGDSISSNTREDAPLGVFRDLSHLSKVYVEKLLEMYAVLHGLRCVSARLALAYGLSPVMKTDDRFITAPNKFCRQLANGEPVTLHSGSDRPGGFIHVSDACSALRALSTGDFAESFVPVNVATEWTSVSTVATIARMLAQERGLLDGVVEGDLSTTLAVGKRLEAAGFQATQTLSTGLAEVLDHFASRAGRSIVAGC